MKSTVLQPGAGQSVVQTSDDEDNFDPRRWGHDGHRNHDRDSPNNVIVIADNDRGNDRGGRRDNGVWESTILGNISDGFRAVQSDLNADSTSLHNNLANGFRSVQGDLSTGFRDNVRDIKDAEANIRYGTKDSEANVRYGLKDSEANIRNDVTSAEGNIRTDVKDAESDIRTDIKDAECDVRDAVRDAESQLARDVKDTRYDLARDLHTGFTTVVRDVKDARFDLVSDLGGRLERGFTANAKAFCQVDANVATLAKEVVFGFKDQQALAYQVEGRALLEAAKNAAAVEIQNERIAAAGVLQAEKLASAQSLLSHQLSAAAAERANSHFAAQNLRAEQIACEAARQAAECCCELKEKITAEGIATRALIEANEKDRLREALRKSEATLQAYFCRNTCPVIPVC